jgi:hypothetical protein
MIDPTTLSEIKEFVKSRQTSDGGFSDRGGNSDIYYTLFGCYIAEALGVNEVMPSLKEYVKNIVQAGKLKGVHLKCAVILYAKLYGSGRVPSSLQKYEKLQATYSDFINLLACYYSENYFALFRIQRKLKTINTSAEMPCSVTAAYLILSESFGKPAKALEIRLNGFYRKNGSFAAVERVSYGDLLSTGVALYALRFVNSEVRVIKPDCLTYIDSLYSEGGFCATVFDPDPDVEYTFYGLLALGALFG